MPVFLLEPPLVSDEEPLEMMEDNPVEDRPLRMARTIDSRYIARVDSRTAPEDHNGNPP
jgi:hypothetical protein